MSINSAVVDLPLSADPPATYRGIEVMAVIRRLVGRPRQAQERPYLNIGDSYRVPDRRRRYDRGPNWVHTHH